MQTKYQGLKTLISISNGFGYVCFILGVFGVVMNFSYITSGMDGLMELMMPLTSIFGAALILIFGGICTVLIDIEANTRPVQEKRAKTQPLKSGSA